MKIITVMRFALKILSYKLSILLIGTLFSVSAAGITPSPVVTTTPAVSPTPSAPQIVDSALKLDISVGEQDYATKQIPVTIEVTSLIDSGRVSVDWLYTSNIVQIVGAKVDNINVFAGQKTTVTRYFEPYPPAISEALAANNVRVVDITVEVRALVPGRNYYATTSTSFNVNRYVEQVPFGAKYQQDRQVDMVQYWGIRIGGVVFVVLAILIAVKKFRDYLNSEDEEF